MATMCIRGTRCPIKDHCKEISPLQHLRVASHKTNLTVLFLCLCVCNIEKIIHIYMPYVHNPESEWKLLWIQLYKKEMVAVDNSP